MKKKKNKELKLYESALESIFDSIDAMQGDLYPWYDENEEKIIMITKEEAKEKYEEKVRIEMEMIKAYEDLDEGIKREMEIDEYLDELEDKREDFSYGLKRPIR